MPTYAATDYEPVPPGLYTAKLEKIEEATSQHGTYYRWQFVIEDEGEQEDRKASSTDLMTWSTFEEAVEAYECGQYGGLGFVFCSGDPYTGVDLDSCVDEDSQIAGWALEIARYFDSYTELSATGTGLHVIVRGDVPNRRKGDIEVYSSKRFFTVTGHIVEVSGD